MSTKNAVVTLLCLATIALTGCESMKPTYKTVRNPSCHSADSDPVKSCGLVVPFDTPTDKYGYPIELKPNSTNMICNATKLSNGEIKVENCRSN